MHSANCAAYVGIPPVQYMVWLLTRPLLRNDRCHGCPFILVYMAIEVVAALVAYFGSGLVMAGFAGDGTIRAVFPPVVVRPKMLVILVGMDQKDSYAARSCLRSSPTWAVACSWLVLLV